jgi:hypothetical protein
MQDTRLHRLAHKLCIRCGKRKTIHTSVNMWKRESRYLQCSKCRIKDRNRKRRNKNDPMRSNES